jgi:rubrerythrin
MKIKNYKCEKCGEHEYSTQVGLNLHLYRVHNVEAPITCPDCLQGFTFESELRVHKKHCTGNTIRQMKARPQDALVDILENGFRCQVCLQIFETRSKWSVHFHHKHKNSNICTFCNKQMASSTSLFKHIQVREFKVLHYELVDNFYYVSGST